MDAADLSATKGSAGARVSSACVPCRRRHVRCDARHPTCIRCSSESRTCEYVKSRRGGLDRARLAQYRRRRELANGSPTETNPDSGPSRPTEAPARSRPTSGDSQSIGSIRQNRLSTESERSDREEAFGTPSSTLFSPSPNMQFSGVAGDPFIQLYYKHFHRSHPCALPQKKLQQVFERNSHQECLVLLVSILRLLGSLYSSCQELSGFLRDKVAEGIQNAHQLKPDPYLAQCHLLYSIFLYWHGDKTQSGEHIDAAIRIVVELRMNERQYAYENGQGDLVIQECWRRTWWQLFIVDAYHAVIKRSPVFSLSAVETDVELPCEEDEYESGTFSSFAYLIGATRSISLALSAVPPETSNYSNWSSFKIIAEVDAIIYGWFLLLPESKKEVLSEGSVIDELMFQAQLAVHATLIVLHRPFSKLPFHPLERISTCLSEPPERLPAKEEETVHTQRCLRSIGAQIRLLVLPVQPSRRCPFTICMTAAGTTTLLAAIKVLFSGRQLAVARHQLRLVVGFLKALAKVWPQGRKNTEEIQTIAQEVLSINSQQHQSPKQPAPDRGVVAAPDPPAVEDVPYFDALDSWDNPTFGLNIDAQRSVEPFWNVNHDFQADVALWFHSY
ncbi:hypothetical protein GGR57DRAFT_489639 [Xylariaceae sp. FL1272]|nr:hypothetical protein GGR57DRAFT_489639 [Xylariaceae sp. FL1272]